MSEYRLSKSNNSNELTNIDEKHEVAKVPDDTKLLPHKKNYLVEVGKGGIEVFAKTGKALVKVTGHALAVIGNKLVQIDWCKVVLTILKELFIKTEEETTYHTTHYTTYSKVYKSSNSVAQTNTQNNNEQIQNTTQKSIENNKTKQINGKKQKTIKNSKNPKQIGKKSDRNIIKPQEQSRLMIEKKKQQKDR